MAHENVVSRDRAPADGRLPVRSTESQLELGDHEVEDPVEDLVLASDVVVDRHGLDAELLREFAHAECLEPALIGDADRGAHDPIPAQRGPGLRAPFYA